MLRYEMLNHRTMIAGSLANYNSQMRSEKMIGLKTIADELKINVNTIYAHIYRGICMVKPSVTLGDRYFYTRAEADAIKAYWLNFVAAKTEKQQAIQKRRAKRALTLRAETLNTSRKGQK